MGGPKTTREPINSAPIQGLTNPLQNLLQGFLQSGQNPFANATQPSALQQQTSASYANALAGGPTAQQNALANSQDMLLGQINGPAGADILSASQPIFQRNLQLGADTLRQSGPRFNSNTERLVADQGNKALQDYNLFAQNVMESGRARQLQAAQTYGGLAQGADNSFNQLLQGAGGFANTMQGQQLNANTSILNQLLGLAGQAGIGPAVLTQHPGLTADILKTVGTIGGLGVSAYGMRGGGVAKSPYGLSGGM